MNIKSNFPSRIRRKYLDVVRSTTEAGNSAVSTPAGRALVLGVAYPATIVAVLSTDEIFNMYNVVIGRVAYINIHNLPLSPPDPIPLLVCGILAAGVTLLFAGATFEVATGKRITELPRLAATLFRELIKGLVGVLERNSSR